MANWFKIYETDLDETRLKYALDKLPEVGWVWIGILSECCKQRSDTIRWGKDEVELFGFSDRLKVSIPKVNEAILLLAKIDYIEILDGYIKVLKWNEKQSDYCVRRERGDYKKNPKYPRVSDNIGDSPREERRGEENREDKRRESRSARASDAFPESKEEALKQCALTALPPDFVVECWDKAHSRGGLDAKGLEIAHFPAYCRTEHKYHRERLEKDKLMQSSGPYSKPPGKSIIEQDIEACERQTRRDLAPPIDQAARNREFEARAAATFKNMKTIPITPAKP